MVSINRLADRLLLTNEVLDFCVTLPIYNTELINSEPSNEDGTTGK